MFYIEVFKTKKGTLCSALKVDLGYAVKCISFDMQLCAEIAGISVRELMSQEQRIDL